MSSYFETLPPELVYKIFRYLNAQTIARSVRCVCRRLYELVNVYDEYDFNFKSIRKCDLIFLCNFIDLNRVQSLTLSNDNQTSGQIEYFLARYRLNYFTELRSLTLIDIENCYLNIILKDIQQLKLNTLKLKLNQDLEVNITNEDFTRVLALPTLQEFVYAGWNNRFNQFSWPSQCALRFLSIRCERLQKFYDIVRYLPNLQELCLHSLYDTVLSGIPPKPDDLQGFHQLKYLKLNNEQIDITVLCIILSLTPTIERFEIINGIDLNEFISNLSELEKFIQENLVLLTKFDFFFYIFNPINDTQTYLSRFQTPFWLSIKKWFVVCDYMYNPRDIVLRTASFYDPNFQLEYGVSQQMTQLCSLSNIANNNNEVKKLSLDLNLNIPSANGTIRVRSMNVRFKNVNELKLNIGDEWPLGSLRYISTMIEISKIEELTLCLGNSFSLSSQVQLNLERLFQLTTNIHTLNIFINSMFNRSIHDDFLTHICSLVPNCVRHLTLHVSSTYQIQNLIEQMKSCSSITFKFVNYYQELPESFINWLECEKHCQTYQSNSNAFSIWLN